MTALSGAENWTLSGCSVHGIRRHTLVHESGHTLAGWQIGVPLIEVIVHRTPQPLTADPTQLALGWNKVDRDALPGLGLHPLHLLDYALSGLAAERALLGDHVPDGYAEDLHEWRRWNGLAAAENYARFMTESNLDLKGIVQIRERWARDHAEMIEALTCELASRQVLKPDDVRAILNDLTPQAGSE